MSILEIPTPWEIVEDSQGFSNIHHPREDDGSCTGDLVATCFQDERHAAMLRAAPELLAALERLVTATDLRALRGRDHVPSMREEQEARWLARTTIASARGAA